MSKEVNPDLYDFMKNNEIHLATGTGENELNVLLFINFHDIEDFINIVGRYYFYPEDQIMVNLQDDFIVIDIYDIITEWFEHKVEDYINCFEYEDWNLAMMHGKLVLESEE